jgi:DNA-binding MarR family transcriptional regulator
MSDTMSAEEDSAGMGQDSGIETIVLHRLLKVSNRLMAPFSTHLEKQYDISINEFRLLMLIGRKGKAVSHELAEMTGVNVMSVSRAVASLEKKGRIRVERDPQNRRRKQLTLTKEGSRLHEIMRPQADRVASYLLSDLKPEEVAALRIILDKLIDTLEAEDEDGNSLFLERTKPE